MAKPTKFLNAESRRKCWSSRDEYFECLGKNKEEADKCVNLRKVFEEQCPKTWVGHFERRRDFLKYKSALETDGFVPTDEKHEEAS